MWESGGSGGDPSPSSHLSCSATTTTSPVSSLPVMSRRRMAFRPPKQPQVQMLSPTASLAPSRSAATPLAAAVSSSSETATASAGASRDDQEEFVVYDEGNWRATDGGSDTAVANGDKQPTLSCVDGKEEQLRRLKRNAWSFDETMIFYEAIKLYGKDFDALLRFMQKRKVKKDKQQLQNYYFNSIKLSRVSSGVDDELSGSDIPRDARELFILVNWLEWKRRTGGERTPPPHDKLKQLILEGAAVFRPRRKKQSVMIKTPPCPALVKFFSYERKADKFPSEVVIRLQPMREGDAAALRDTLNARNPLIRVRIATWERVSRIFDVLYAKWAGVLDKRGGVEGLRLFPSLHTQVGKVVVQQCPLAPTVALSIKRLLEDRERVAVATEQVGANGLCNVEPSYSVQVAAPMTLGEEMLSQGLTRQQVAHAAVCELYCLCGMTSEITLVYSIPPLTEDLSEPFRVLVDLLGREYGEWMYRKEDGEKEAGAGEVDDDEPAILPATPTPIPIPTTQHMPVPVNKRSLAQLPASQSKPMLESAVVAEENAAFAQQLAALGGAGGRKRTVGGGKRKRPLQVMTTATTVPRTPDRETPRTPREQTNSVATPAAVDFSNEMRAPSSLRRSNRTRRTPEKIRECSRGGASRGGTSRTGDEYRFAADLESQIFGGPLDLSPMKSLSGLPDDVRLSVDQMMSQSSSDYFANFAQLASTLESTPTKRSRLENL